MRVLPSLPGQAIHECHSAERDCTQPGPRDRLECERPPFRGARRPMNKIPVAVRGATGAVGQRFIQLLENHPWFEVAEVAASDRSAGKPYREAATWRLARALPEAVAGLKVTTIEGPFRSKILFSGLDSSVAGEAEEALARQGH